MGRLQGKVAIVTGGARGMGAATSRLFAKEGAAVVIADILAEEGEALARELGEKALFVRLDVRNEDEWKQVGDAALSRFGRIDVLVNNAAVVHFCDIENMAKEDLERVLGINVIGTLLGIKTIAPAMKQKGKGSIINISSIDGLRGCNGLSAYTASKWAVRGLTKSAALEFGPFGVRVNSIHPGGVDTVMGNPAGRPDAELNKDYTAVPLQRIGKPEEIANASLFLASDEASYVAGAELSVDGGWCAGYYQPALPGAPQQG